MKKVFVFFLIFLVSLVVVFAKESDAKAPYVTGSLDVGYRYRTDDFYHFMFSDVDGKKVGIDDFIFDNPGLVDVKMTTVNKNHLVNDSPLFITWMVDDSTPIDKLTISVGGPLVLKDHVSGMAVDSMDWYASIGSLGVIGGQGAYGPSNAIAVYDRKYETGKTESGLFSLPVELWTGDISHKKSGFYEGALILDVYGER